MTSRVSYSDVFYAFSPDIEPVLRVPQGEEFVIQTNDCFSQQLKSDADKMATFDWSVANPATGAVWVEGAKSGDILRVDLLEVRATDQCVMVAIPEVGVLGDVIKQEETVVLRQEGDELVFKDKIRVKQDPMIGVIGVAPAEGSIPNSTPGEHGGNMDCTLVKTGASLYFRVGVEGALFGCGDMHARMGDGEIVICGAETPGEVRARAQVVDLPGLPVPFLENEDVVVAIASAETADAAYNDAVHRMHTFLTGIAGLTVNDAGLLMSLVGDLRFCQVVDPLITVRFEFPKSVLANCGYSLPR